MTVNPAAATGSNLLIHRRRVVVDSAVCDRRRGVVVAIDAAARKAAGVSADCTAGNDGGGEYPAIDAAAVIARIVGDGAVIDNGG